MYPNLNAASAYKTASRNVTSLRAVVMLYDAMIQALYRAKTALEEGRLEDRFNETQKAAKIILGLQANIDFEAGGRMALMLDQFYHTIFRDLQNINHKNSASLCEATIVALKDVRASWLELAERQDRGELAVAQNAGDAKGQEDLHGKPSEGEREQKLKLNNVAFSV